VLLGTPHPVKKNDSWILRSVEAADGGATVAAHAVFDQANDVGGSRLKAPTVSLWQRLTPGDKVLVDRIDGSPVVGVIDEFAANLDIVWIIDTRTGERKLVTEAENRVRRLQATDNPDTPDM
jgi:hypothetical protein